MSSGVRSAVARILVVEDDEDLRDALVESLGVDGHAVRGVHDGASALESARTSPFDCVLLDIGLPGMSGLDVARELRRRGFSGTIIAMSGYARNEDRANALSAGCDRYLVKPVEQSLLLETVARSRHRADTGPDEVGPQRERLRAPEA